MIENFEQYQAKAHKSTKSDIHFIKSIIAASNCTTVNLDNNTSPNSPKGWKYSRGSGSFATLDSLGVTVSMVQMSCSFILM